MKVLTAQQLMDWAYFHQDEPFSVEMADSLNAQTCSVLANINRDVGKKKDPFTISDFTIFRERKPEKVLTPEEIDAEFEKAWG